jgi:hypothetical protein
MDVSLSAIWGAGAQLFDNSGKVLTGGRVYTYYAGTTTPDATYISSSGLVAHSNPIILDASGRIPYGGEIWLVENKNYKFILKDSNDVLISSFDSVGGINSSFTTNNSAVETKTATQGQTIFVLATMKYTPGAKNLLVCVNGSKQLVNVNFVETNSTTVTFIDGLNEGDLVEFSTSWITSSVTFTAPNVTTDQKLVISDLSTGHIVFDTTLQKLCVYTSSGWETLTSVLTTPTVRVPLVPLTIKVK